MLDFNKGSLFKLCPVNPSEGNREIEMMLVEDEQVLLAFRAVNDLAVMTNKRLVLVNVKGVNGKKRDYTSLPLSKVQAFSVETAGVLDRDCEVELWFAGLGRVSLEITGNFDIRTFNRILSAFVFTRL